MKYELVIPKTQPRSNYDLMQVRYLVDIQRHGIKAGDMGGYIDSTSMLSQDGDCAIVDGSVITNNSRIVDDCIVSGTATISRSYLARRAIIRDKCAIHESIITDDAVVMGQSSVFGCRILNAAQVNCRNAGHAKIGGRTIIRPTANGLPSIGGLPYQHTIEITGGIIEGNATIDGWWQSKIDIAGGLITDGANISGYVEIISGKIDGYLRGEAIVLR